MELAEIKRLWDGMRGMLNEKQRRQYAAMLAEVYGYGGATLMQKISGLSRNTIIAGKKEIDDPTTESTGRVRTIGGGRKLVEEKYPNIQDHIKLIVEGSTYGNPERILSWTTDSMRGIAKKLKTEYNEEVSHMTVGSILEELGYSKQANQKMLQVGKPHPNRNEQFSYINEIAKKFIDEKEPVISVDTKKKESIGNFKNSGRELRKTKDPRKVFDHDFPIKELGKIAPYGVYCQNNNTGFVNVGTSHDTADFAVESIKRWWTSVGKQTFPKATKLLITCDCGGSNGNRTRLWKYNLAQLAKQIGIEIHVCHFPPGTSKWNKVEHRLFCFISKHWQGKPLIDVQTAINLIGSTTTETGLSVVCQRDDTVYETAQSVSDEEFNGISLTRTSPFGEWNYVVNMV